MIKKIFFPLIIVLICFLLAINYLAYKSPSESKIITQQKVYSLTSDNNLNILIYTNKKTAFTEIAAIEKVYLESIDEVKKLELDLLNITALNKYKYLKENYQEYKFTFKLPELNDYFYIDEAYLYIRLKNALENKFKIGSFDYFNSSEVLNVVELFGKRYSDFPTLESVSLRFSLTEDIFVEHVYLSKNIFTYVGKTVKDNDLLIVNFKQLDKITNELTIKIDYQINGEFYTTNTPYFIFYETNENPLEYSLLNNVYLLD